MTEERPWGKFTVLYDGPDCKVKRILVNHGHRLSLQSHEKRTEHWTVIYGSGHAEVNGFNTWLVPGSHIVIPAGAKHRITNDGDGEDGETLVFIEVQIGSYFGEDDIVRYEDDYSRV